MPALSLCLATYNRARYLDRYLGHHTALLDESGLDYEIVVSDNASTDQTPEILARWAAANPRIRVVRQPANRGAHANILTSLHLARGEVLVSIADDDLAEAGPLIDYANRLIADEALVMIQAPWLLVDETRDGVVTGQFYSLDAERRFGRGDYGPALAFILDRHVFPECFLLRRTALASVVGPAPPFAYGYFAMLAAALSQGEVLFAPRPHIRATAVSREGHIGNSEAMEAWDTYRGGLELLASYARQARPDAMPGADALAGAFLSFTVERMAVAARLQAHARNWAAVWAIQRRLHGYGHSAQLALEPGEVALLAAIESCLIEATQRGATTLVIGDSLPDHVLERVKPPPGARLARTSTGDGVEAWIGVGEAPPGAGAWAAFALDVLKAMERTPSWA